MYYKTNTNKCVNCLFRARYLNVDICKRHQNISDGARAVEKPAPCQYHITKKQVAELQEKVDLQALLREKGGEENA